MSLSGAPSGPFSERSLVSLGFGASLLFSGAVLLVIGALAVLPVVFVEVGVGATRATDLAAVGAGAVVPLLFVGVLATLPPARRTRSAGVAGALLALVGVAWTLTLPTGWAGAGEVPPGAVLTYAAGTLVTVCSLLAAGSTALEPPATADAVYRSTDATRPSATNAESSSAAAGDGGTEDDDLSFPLEDGE